MAIDADADSQSKGERTRHRILVAAAELLGDEGYHGATLSDIAKKSSMQAGSLYYHFESKDAIVEEVLQVGIDNAGAAIDAALADLGPNRSGQVRFEAAIRAYLRAILEEASFTRANIRCYDEAPEEIRQRSSKRVRSLINQWVALYGEGVLDGSLRADIDPSVLTRMVMAALNSCARWLGPGDQSADEVAEMFASAVLDGCAKT